MCGLGSLGQHCVAALKGFGVSVIAIDNVQPQDWEISNLPDVLDEIGLFKLERQWLRVVKQ